MDETGVVIVDVLQLIAINYLGLRRFNDLAEGHLWLDSLCEPFLLQCLRHYATGANTVLLLTHPSLLLDHVK